MGGTITNIQKNKRKFLFTMIIIIGSTALLNYGIFTFLKGFFDTTETVYDIVQLNIITCVVIIGAVTVIMMLLIPKESVDNALLEMNSNKPITPDQELRDMIDYKLDDKKNDLE